MNGKTVDMIVFFLDFRYCGYFNNDFLLKKLRSRDFKEFQDSVRVREFGNILPYVSLQGGKRYSLQKESICYPSLHFICGFQDLLRQLRIVIGDILIGCS